MPQNRKPCTVRSIRSPDLMEKFLISEAIRRKTTVSAFIRLLIIENAITAYPGSKNEFLECLI